MTGHISSVIEESTFEYQVKDLKDRCTVTYSAQITKKLEKPKSKAGQMWTQALNLSKMANEIIDIETAVNRKKKMEIKDHFKNETRKCFFLIYIDITL